MWRRAPAAEPNAFLCPPLATARSIPAPVCPASADRRLPAFADLEAAARHGAAGGAPGAEEQGEQEEDELAGITPTTLREVLCLARLRHENIVA